MAANSNNNSSNNVGLICPCERAEYYVRHLKKSNFTIRALWTPSFEITVQFAAEHEIPFAASRPDEVVLRKEVEMVVITDRPSVHAQIAVKALGIGKHVLCDSPAALTAADACKMVEAAQYYPQLLSLVGYGLRQLEVFKKMKTAFDDGFLGRPVVCEAVVRCGALHSRDEYDWLWEHSMGGGVLNVIGSHVIDLLSYMTSCRAARVQGVVRNLRRNSSSPSSSSLSYNNNENGEFVGYCHRKLNADDFASFLLKFADTDEMTATVTLNSLCDNEFRQEVLFTGPGGQLKAENLSLYRRLAVGGSDGGGGGEFELLFDGSNDVADLNSKKTDGVPKFYARTFLNVCENVGRILPLFSAAPIDIVNNRENGEFPTSNNAGEHQRQRISAARTACEIAGFEDAQYVRAVIDAVRHSSCKGDWVKVEMFSQQEAQFV